MNKNKKVTMAFCLVGIAMISLSCGNSTCDYNGIRYDPTSPVGYAIIRFEEEASIDERIGSWQNMILLASSWYDMFADGDRRGKFGHDISSSRMIHIIDPRTDEGWLAWKGSREQFQTFGIPTPDPRFVSCNGETTALSKTYRISMCSRVADYCNPPSSIGVTIEDEFGKKKQLELPMK